MGDATLAAMAATAAALAAVIARLSPLGRRTWTSLCFGMAGMSVSLLFRVHPTPTAAILERVASVGAATFFVHALVMYRTVPGTSEEQHIHPGFWKFVAALLGLLTAAAAAAVLAPEILSGGGLLARAEGPLWIIAVLVMMGLLRSRDASKQQDLNATAGTFLLTAAAAAICFDQPPLVQYRPQGLAEALTIVTVLLGIWFLFSSLAMVLRAEATEQKRLYEQMFHDATLRRQAEEQAELRNAELSTMLRVGDAIASAHRLEEVLDVVSAEVLKILRASRCTIRLLDGAGWVATTMATATRQDDGTVIASRRRAVPGNDSESDSVELDADESNGSGDADTVPSGEHARVDEPIVKATLSVPLVAEGENLGVLCVEEHENERTFTPQEAALCQGIGDQVSMGLQRARLLDELQKRSKQLESLSRSLREANRALAQLAAVDTTTGVFNRRLLEVKLRSEIERCARHGHEICVLMADLDNFKEYNDTAGHPAGDRALRRIAMAIREGTRASDIVGRFGGDEFLVVLPETTPKEAAVVADKMRRIVDHLYLAGQEKMMGGGVTISCGIASWAGPGDDWKAMIQRADGALYQAKHEGANAVRVAPGA